MINYYRKPDLFYFSATFISWSFWFTAFAYNSFDALYHFGGINLFNDPQEAKSEFIHVFRKDGIVSWGDEGFLKAVVHRMS